MDGRSDVSCVTKLYRKNHCCPVKISEFMFKPHCVEFKDYFILIEI